MKIQIKTSDDELRLQLQGALQAEVSRGKEMNKEPKIQWELCNLPSIFDITDWVFQPNAPALLMIDADNAVLLNALQTSQGELSHLIGSACPPPFVRCPIILVFKDTATLSAGMQLPEFLSDWILAANLSTEAIPRMMGALQKTQIMPALQQPAALTLMPKTRTMIYKNTSARLTPAEYTLLELFLSNIGSIISLQELVQTFRGSGKSAEANNIRVAIYQLRLKLDTLTKSQMPLTSVYRQGYCLRQKQKSIDIQLPISTMGHQYGLQNPI